jgi:hypothetical protein
MHVHSVSPVDLAFQYLRGCSRYSLLAMSITSFIRTRHLTTLEKSLSADSCTGAVYLSKITGGPVTDEEARNMLGRFGAIEETCPTTVADQQMHGLPEGIWIKFAYFMDCKDAIAVTCSLFLTDLISTANSCNPVQEFRHNQFYKLHVQEKNERGQQGSTASPSSNRGSNRGFRQGSDAKAIFVGGLPVTVTEDQLRDIFNPYGNILDCKVIRKSLVGKFLVRRFNYIH